MQIVLVRHGKPLMDENRKVSALGFKRWIEEYNAAPLENPGELTYLLAKIVCKCNYVVCSNLRRSIESAKSLGVENVHETNSEFREMEIPYGVSSFFRLKAKIWLLIFRLMWFCGYSNGCESFSHEKKRAKAVASQLVTLAQQNSTVAFIGHGVLNKYIVKNLVASGWQETVKLGHNYWSHGVYTPREVARKNRTVQ